MISIKEDIDCCGCEACAQTCPVKAITMQRDRKGFLYPHVDLKSCNDCKQCEGSCPILQKSENREPIIAFALKNKDTEIRKNSSSGGVFSILADEVIRKGGTVYGASFDESWCVRHSRIDRVEDLYRLRGSKYVQSVIGETYRKVKEDVCSGKLVLFSGTPCQVAGLKNYLRKNYNNLLTVDFVCHGIPNPRIWTDYLQEIKASNQIDSICNINFRAKKRGWLKFCFLLSYKKNPSLSNVNDELYFIEEEGGKNSYMKPFLKNYTIRPSCHNCHFRCGKSSADYTIADYWGIDKIFPDFFDDLGISMLLSNELDLPEILKEHCFVQQTTITQAKEMNPSIEYNWPVQPEESVFYFLHDRLNFSINNSYQVAVIVEFLRFRIDGLIKRTKRLMLL